MWPDEACARGRAAIALGCLLWASAGCDAIDPARLTPVPSILVDGGEVRDGGPMPDASRPDGGGPQQECLGLDELDTCTRPNAVTSCFKGDCLLVECIDGFVDCDGEADNGCEATLISTEHCGLCGVACALPNATASCASGRCEFSGCEPDFDDCDGNPGNGCETSLRSVQNCGGCRQVCEPIDNGVPDCETGSCGVGACLDPFGDCDGRPENGCEQPLVGDEHCGGCGQTCEPPNAVGDCASGACVVSSCVGDRVDCNGLPGDGCEATLDTAEHCGRCGSSCELPRALRMRCEIGEGGVASCTVDHRCPAGAEGCTDGAPENGCEPGYADCNGVGADGCEARLDSLENCGACGDTCSFSGAITSCESGTCAQVGCEPGFGPCGPDGTCISLASDEDHCGACGNACTGEAPNCHGGRCTSAMCPAGSADCNGDGTCEAQLNTTAACGLCEVSCGPFANAAAACQAGRCVISSCNGGFGDCDSAVHNGCEVNLRTLDTCGACGMGCAIPGARASCATGTCTLDQCNPGRADCNSSLVDGCETNIDLPENCGACGLDCRELQNVLSGGCAEQRCEIICAPGFADCDGRANNGCEADLRAAATCRSCNVDCTNLPNVQSATCGSSGCRDLVCAPGYANCDGIASNGCERSTRTLSDCGSCDTPCAPARASATCSTGTCRITTCDQGFADCDNSAGNGCEASLSSPSTCGSCTTACADDWACTNGSCTCVTSEQCGTNEECCNGSCVNTNNVCSWWPCPVASTNRPLLHCDGCNRDCRLLGAQWCCAL